MAAAAAIAETNTAARGPAREYGEVTVSEKADGNEEFLREEGGYLDKIPGGPEVVVADFRAKPADDVAGRVAATIRTMYKMAATNIAAAANGDVHGESVAVRRGRKALMVVALADEGASLAIYPEDRVAIVGAKAATEYARKPKDAETRLVKELWRGFGFLAGSGYAQNKSSVMQPVGSPLELDAIEWQVVHPMALAQMSRFFKTFGAKQGHRATYRSAVEEGWAPLPTNDYQRAIWAEFHKAEKAE